MPTYYHISKTTKSEVIDILDKVYHRLRKSDSCKDANIARRSKILKKKLEKLFISYDA